MKKTTKESPEQGTKPEALMIGALTFTESIAPAVRGDPRIIFRGDRKNTGYISFNAAAVEAMPELGAVDRVRVFIADGKPAVALFPCGAGEGTTFMRDGAKAAKLRKKIQGRSLLHFKAEAIESPRKGWLLTPTSSERKA